MDEIKVYSLSDWTDNHPDLEKGFIKGSYDPNYLFKKGQIGEETLRQILILQEEAYDEALQMTVNLFKLVHRNNLSIAPDKRRKLYHELEIRETQDRLYRDIESWQKVILGRKGFAGINGIEYRNIVEAKKRGNPYGNRLMYKIGREYKFNGLYNSAVDFEYLQWLQVINEKLDSQGNLNQSRDWQECTFREFFVNPLNMKEVGEILYQMYTGKRNKDLAIFLLSIREIRGVRIDVTSRWGVEEARMLSDLVDRTIKRQDLQYHIDKFLAGDPDFTHEVKAQAAIMSDVLKNLIPAKN